MRPGRVVATVLALAYTALLFFLTLGPIRQRLIGDEAPGGVLNPVIWLTAETWTSGRLYEFVANVVVFVPWGFLVLLALGIRWWWVAAFAGLALTLTIEIGQIPLPRISDPRDLVANMLGTLVGIALAVTLVRRRDAALRRRGSLERGGEELLQG